jgi:hypothetical protein
MAGAAVARPGKKRFKGTRVAAVEKQQGKDR